MALLEQLICPQLVKNLSQFYGNPRLITVLKTARHLFPTLRRISTVYGFAFHFFKIHFSIILPLTLTYFKRSSSFITLKKSSASIYLFHALTKTPNIILVDFINLTIQVFW